MAYIFMDIYCAKRVFCGYVEAPTGLLSIRDGVGYDAWGNTYDLVTDDFGQTVFIKVGYTRIFAD